MWHTQWLIRRIRQQRRRRRSRRRYAIRWVLAHFQNASHQRTTIAEREKEEVRERVSASDKKSSAGLCKKLICNFHYWHVALFNLLLHYILALFSFIVWMAIDIRTIQRTMWRILFRNWFNFPNANFRKCTIHGRQRPQSVPRQAHCRQFPWFSNWKISPRPRFFPFTFTPHRYCSVESLAKLSIHQPVGITTEDIVDKEINVFHTQISRIHQDQGHPYCVHHKGSN